MIKLLWIDDDEALVEDSKLLFAREGISLIGAATVVQALMLLRKDLPDGVLLDVRLGGKENGLELLKEIRAIYPDLRVAIFTGYPQYDDHGEAVAAGALAYVPKIRKSIPLSRRKQREFFRGIQRIFRSTTELGQSKKPTVANDNAKSLQQFAKSNQIREKQMQPAADCAIISALPSELDKVLFHFRHWRTVNGHGGRAFHETTSPNGLSLLAAVATNMGQLSAASLVRDVIQAYQPNTIILVGIAGGLDRRIPLGDVVVSEQIVDYEIGKVGAGGFEPRWSAYQPDQALLNKFRNFRDERWVDYVRTARPSTQQSQRPTVRAGVYLSGNKVIADETMAGSLKAVWQRAAAIEMEAAGIAASLREMRNPPGFIVFKAICDYADSTKNDDWQAYAADAAASFAYSFVYESLEREDVKLKSVTLESNDEIEGIPFRAIRIALASAFNMSELRVLFSDVETDWDEVAGDTKSAKIAELLSYLRRRNRLDHLIQVVNKDRNNLLAAYRNPTTRSRDT